MKMNRESLCIHPTIPHTYYKPTVFNQDQADDIDPIKPGVKARSDNK
jgi:hypothetical protein